MPRRRARSSGPGSLRCKVESRRSSHGSLELTLARASQQLEELRLRRDELARQLADGDAPLEALQRELETALALRAQIEEELRAARIASEELDAVLRERDSRRSEIEERVESARGLLDGARLGAEQVRVRREGIAEQLGSTQFELAALLASLAENPDASAVSWESRLEETRGKIERLGQVNLAAIGEFKEQSERKEYLDRQCKDLTDALETLESAMRKIDRETRARFAGYVRSRERRAEGEVSAPVRRRPCLSRACGRGCARPPACR